MFKGGLQIIDLSELGDITESLTIVNASKRSEKVIKTIIDLTSRKSYLKPCVICFKQDIGDFITLNANVQLFIGSVSRSVNIDSISNLFPYITIEYSTYTDILKIGLSVNQKRGK